MTANRLWISFAAAAAGAAGLGGCAAAAAQPEAEPAIGTARVGLLGDYAGRRLRIEVEGRVLAEGRLPYPPPGAEDRYDAEIGPERVAVAGLTIEGCDPAWTGPIRLAPQRTSYLLIQGCEVQTLAPD